MQTLCWVITYRLSSKEPQQQVTKYTKAAAESFAATIEEVGGVAVITEDMTDIPERSDELKSSNQLDWSEQNG